MKKIRLLGRVGAGAVALSAALTSSLSQATASLTWTFTDVTCSVTTSAGTTVIPCPPPSTANSNFDLWYEYLIPSQGQFSVSATLAYTYTDDGYDLASPAHLQLISEDPYTWSEMFPIDQTFTTEAGWYAVTSPGVASIRGSGPRWFNVGPNQVGSFAVLGSNDLADSLTGAVTFVTTVTNIDGFPRTWGTGLDVSFGAFSGQAPNPAIPEPSTYALMGLGLVGVALASRRQRARVAMAA